jgi:hypothetical protein
MITPIYHETITLGYHGTITGVYRIGKRINTLVAGLPGPGGTLRPGRQQAPGSRVVALGHGYH